MDLELALGHPVDGMTERDFRRWQRYSNKKGFPTRRLEFYLAQLAMLFSHLMGGSEEPLSSFLFDAKFDEPSNIVTDAEVEEMKKILNFKPRKKKHG